MRSQIDDLGERLRVWCARLPRLVPGLVGGLVLMAPMATAQESKDAPETGADPFSQRPGPPVAEPYRLKGPIWTLPPILGLYEVGPEECGEWLEAYNRLTPEDIERFRAEYLAKFDPKEFNSRGSILSATSLILRKFKQFDEQGIAYDRDILIETILEKVEQDFPLDITANFRYLKGTRDPRIHNYVASFLDHEMELVRKAAAETLPTVDPGGETPPTENGGAERRLPGEVEAPAVAREEMPDRGSNDDREGLGGLWWVVIGSVAVLLGLLAFGLRRGRR